MPQTHQHDATGNTLVYLQEAQAFQLPKLPGTDTQALPEAAPALIPRKSLRQNFAVLLLRSVYEAADEMDFMPMVSAVRVHVALSWSCTASQTCMSQ